MKNYGENQKKPVITIDLTQTELFASFAEIGNGDAYVDLHNEFYCYSINYSQNQSQLSFSFKASKNNSRKIQHVELTFKNVIIEVMNFKIDNGACNSEWTLNIAYRGRFEDQNAGLGEVSNEGKYYYYLDFYDDYSFEVFSDSVIAELK